MRAVNGTPGVSFVIPVYNKRAFLPQVIDGLKAQRGDFAREFVFVDDGSTDGSAAALAELTAGWAAVRVLQQPNRGPSNATNRAIAVVRFAVIKFVDGDDVLLPDATGMLLDLLRRHSAAVLAFGRTGVYRSPAEARAILAPVIGPPPEHSPTLIEDPLPMLLRQTDLGPSNCLVRTQAVREAGGCDERVFTQDYSLLLRLAARGAFVGTDREVALCPVASADRVNDGGPQVLHDSNLALFHFISERALPRRMVRVAVRRAATRAWLWARRREKAGAISRWLLLRGLAYLPIARLQLILLRRSCDAFTLSRPVRHSGGA
jgi:cellulose synthase/poly-beta-1,6-N-acetylglucosamine synthase-like glycosyltransferase